jgi:hypothetical protein
MTDAAATIMVFRKNRANGCNVIASEKFAHFHAAGKKRGGN